MRGEQSLGVGMLRVSHKIAGPGSFDNLAPVHDQDPVGEVPHRREVVGDVDDPQVVLLLDLLKSCKISTRTETSSIETGSSATIIRGSKRIAHAITRRCCWPPLSWWGNLER